MYICVHDVAICTQFTHSLYTSNDSRNTVLRQVWQSKMLILSQIIGKNELPVVTLTGPDRHCAPQIRLNRPLRALQILLFYSILFWLPEHCSYYLSFHPQFYHSSKSDPICHLGHTETILSICQHDI